MKEKTYFFTIAFLIFSHLQNFLKIGIDTHPIDLSCHQKFEKNSPIRSGDNGARSWKHGKSQGRLDHTLRMREVVRALTNACETTVSIRTFSLWERDIFPFDCFTGYKKSHQNQLGRVLLFAFALTCYKCSARARSRINLNCRAILVPRAYDPSGLRQESRALGATISGMRHRCRCAVSQITRIRLFPLFFHNGCSQSSRYLPQARRIVGSRDENAVE